MTVAGAVAAYLVSYKQGDSTVDPPSQPSIQDQSLSLFAEYFPRDAALTDINAESLRDFLSRWYPEQAGVSKLGNSPPVEVDAHSNTSRVLQALKPRSARQMPGPADLLASLSAFLTWADRQAGADHAAHYAPMLTELSRSLPRAREISEALSRSLRELGGAFSFPEFLTSFEEGGSSQYDIDVPGNVGAIDGYFRIVRVDGSSVEAEDLISEQRVWPIFFPAEVAALLEAGYIINLELVRKREGWQIAGCGFTYPPGTGI